MSWGSGPWGTASPAASLVSSIAATSGTSLVIALTLSLSLGDGGDLLDHVVWLERRQGLV